MKAIDLQNETVVIAVYEVSCAVRNKSAGVPGSQEQITQRIIR